MIVRIVTRRRWEAMTDGERTFRLELTGPELRVVHAALKSFDNDFGHDERDVRDRIRAVVRKLPEEAIASPQPLGS
jgi:hypothetical protein